MNDVAPTLAATPLCRDLSADEVARIADEGRIEHWPEGSIVLEEGDAGQRLVIVLDGHASVVKRDRSGAEHEIARLGPGAVLGEMGLLLERTRSATVRALLPLRVFAMDRDVFREMVDAGDPAALKMGFAVARALAGRIDAQNTRLVDLLEEIADSRKRESFLQAQSELQWRWDF